MWQQLGDVAGFVCRQTREDVFEVRVRVVSVELRKADQTRDRGGTLTCSQRARK
jgi:hypothetical protein